jgi:hypothetical protein
MNQYLKAGLVAIIAVIIARHVPVIQDYLNDPVAK